MISESVRRRLSTTLATPNGAAEGTRQHKKADRSQLNESQIMEGFLGGGSVVPFSEWY